MTHTKELFLHAGKKLQQAASAYSLLNLDSLMNLTSLAGAFQDETCVVTCVVTWHKLSIGSGKRRCDEGVVYVAEVLHEVEIFGRLLPRHIGASRSE